MKKAYKAPGLIRYGWIGHHTFDNPGVGDKSDNTEFLTDKFGEFSHPAEAAS